MLLDSGMYSTILYVHEKLLLQYSFMWVYVYMCTCISYEKLQLSGDFVAVHAQSCSPLHVCEVNSAVILHSKMVPCCYAENGNDELYFLWRKSQSFIVKDGLAPDLMAGESSNMFGLFYWRFIICHREPWDSGFLGCHSSDGRKYITLYYWLGSLRLLQKV